MWIKNVYENQFPSKAISQLKINFLKCPQLIFRESKIYLKLSDKIRNTPYYL